MSETQPQIRSIRLDQLRLDGGTQPRIMINEKVVAEYAELYREGHEFPPVTVFFDGATHWLTDGFHRYHASKKAGKEEITAEIHIGTQRDAILHSVGANAAHGLRRTNADKRKAVLTLLKDGEWSGYSDRDIARRCRVSNTMVGRIREFSLSQNDSEKLAGKPNTRKYTNKHGSVTEMKTDKIGHSQKSSSGKASPSKKASAGKNSPGKCVSMSVDVIALLRHDPRQSARKLVQYVESDYMVAFVDELDRIQQSTNDFQPIKRKGRDLKQTRLRLSHNPTRGAEMIIEAIGEEYAKELIVSLTNCINQK